MTETPTILSKRTRKDKHNHLTLQRLWRRKTPPPLTFSVMFMSKRNYRVISDVSSTSKCTIRVCAVLNTSAGPNFVRRGDLPSTDVQISSGLKQTISDAICRPLNEVGTSALYVRFGSYEVKCHFYVLERLSISYVLGGDFCDRFVEAINPR